MIRQAIVRDDNTAEDAFETALSGVADVDTLFGERDDRMIDDNGLRAAIAPFGTLVLKALDGVTGVTIYHDISTWKASSGWEVA